MTTEQLAQTTSLKGATLPDCSNCDTYNRFRAGDETGLVNPENKYRCCWLPRDYLEGRGCEIRTCCEEKGILFCGECGQFEGCARMEFYSKPGYNELRVRMLEAVRKRTREGLTQVTGDD